MSHAVVVGAGITGLAAAWALIRRGWTAEVLEAGPIPNPEAASADAHRLIRSHYAGQPGYAARIPEAFAAWEALWRDLGARHYVPRGILALSRKAGDWTERAGEALAAAGQPHEVLGANEAAARFPTFEMAGVRFALFTEGGGALLADRILAGLRGWLTAQGTVLRPHRAATGVDPAAGRVETAAGPVTGDAVVLAGVLLPGVPAPEVVPMRSTVLWAHPPPGLAAAWAEAPCWVDLGGADDHWGMPPMAGLPMKLGLGRMTRPGDPATERPTTPADVAEILAAYRGRFRDWEGARPIRAAANFYRMAPGARFHLGQTGRVFTVAADSGHGFKFGALTGLDLAEAVTEGRIAAVARRMAGETT